MEMQGGGALLQSPPPEADGCVYLRLLSLLSEPGNYPFEEKVECGRMTKIDFDVTVAGISCAVRVEYQEEDIPEEIQGSPYDIMGFRWKEAVTHLEQEIGHSDFEINYWVWL